MDSFNNTYFILYGSCGLIAFMLAALLDKDKFRSNFFMLGLLFVALFALLFGFRDLEVGADTQLYNWQYINSQYIDNWGTDIFIKVIFTTLKAIFGDDPVSFFLFMAIVFNGTVFLSTYYFSKIYSVNILFVLFIFFSMFFYKTLGINIIRQGVSLGFFILGIVLFFYNNKKKIPVIISFVLSILFHFTSIIPIILLIGIYYSHRKISLKYFYIFYVLSIILSFLNLGVNKIIDSGFVSTIDERRSNYLQSGGIDDLYQVGFKPQFVIFNTFFLLLAVYMKKRMDKMNIKDTMYLIILKGYVLLSCIFFLFFHIPYSDRWGVISWILIPFLVVPYFSKKHNKLPLTCIVLGLIGIFLFFNNL